MVLDVEVDFGQPSGFGIGPFTKPTGALLEVGEIVLEVGDSDFAYARPVLFLGIQGGHRHRRFEVSLGVTVSGLQAADESFAGIAETEVKSPLDDYSSDYTWEKKPSFCI